MKRAALATLVIAVMLTAPLTSLFAQRVPAAEAATTKDDFDLAQHWAPRWYQDIDSGNQDADYFTNFDFDGDWIGTNNWENQENASYELKAYVYYWVVETETHWFVGYVIFHPRHWDVPSHENDMGGCLLVIEKDGTDYGQLLLMLTTGAPDSAHQRFYSYEGPAGALTGDDGNIQLEGWRPNVYVEAKSHHVYGHSPFDGDQFLSGGGGVIYYHAGEAGVPAPSFDVYAGYALKSIDELWDRRDSEVYSDTFSEFGTFKEGTGAANAAMAPWGWDDATTPGHWVEPPDFFMHPAHLVDYYYYHSDLTSFSQNYLYRSYGGIVESFHPSDIDDPRYVNYERTWSWKVEGAQHIRVHFEKIKTETSDYITFEGCEGTLVLISRVDDEMVGDGVKRVFKLGHRVIADSETITVGGAAQADPADYSIVDDTGVITFVVAPPDGAVILATYEAETVFGSHEDYWSPWVPDDTIKIKLTNNWNTTLWGFSADRYEASPDIQTPVADISFDDITLGSSSDQVTTLFNDNGSIDPLTIDSVTWTSGSSDFTYVGPATSFEIPVDGSQAITIRFTPTSEGSKSTTFTVNSNAPDHPGVTFNVSGEGVNQPPTTPDNTSPDDGAGILSLTPTLESSPFDDPDAGHTHGASWWQITTTPGDYSSWVYESVDDTSNLTQISVPSDKLSYNTVYYWHVRHQDDYYAWSDWSTETSFIVLRAPDTPTNVSPADGAVEATLTPTLQSSSFSDPDGDTHAASEWEIATDTEFADMVYDETGTAVTQIAVPLGELSTDTTYYWHVRHQDNYDAWSEWSTETSFSISMLPDTPSNAHPADGGYASLTPALQSSAFSDPEEDSHAASQWQITTTAGDYSSPAFDSEEDSDNLTEITVPSGTLSYDATYYWHVRHQASRGAWSEWSDETSFTSVPPPEADFSASPTSGEEPLTVRFTDRSTGRITSWEWDFDGDGNVDSAAQSPTYTYEESGKYTVSLTVTGEGGSDTRTASITVEEGEDNNLVWIIVGVVLAAVLGVCLVTGYYLVRRASQRRRA